jgi:WD40 repeat protein
MSRIINGSVFLLLAIISGVPAADQKNPVSAKSETRVDLYGDPLPSGAIARIGSIRLRHAALSDLIYLSDGKTILSAGGDRILRYWDIATGKPVRTTNLQGTSGPGTCVTLSPDGKTLVSQVAQSLVFWEVATGKELKNLPVPNNQFVSYMYFSPDGKTLGVHSGPATVSLWDWAEGKERVLNLPIQAQGFNGMGNSNHGYFSHDGKTFGTGGGFMHPLILWEVATGKEIRRFDCAASIFCFSPDDKLLAVACMKQGGGPVTFRLLEISTGKELFQKEAPENGFFWWVEFSPDMKTIAFVDQKHIYLLDRETGNERRRLEANVRQLFFSPDGKWMMGNKGNRIRLWEVATGKEMHAHPGLNNGPSAIAVSPDGRKLASATYYYGEPLTIWDTPTGKKLHALDVADNTGYGFVQGLSFSPDNKTLFAGAGSGQLHFWDAATFKKIKTVQLQDPGKGADAMNFQRVHLSSDGRRVVTVDRNWGPMGESDQMAVWDLDTARITKQLTIAGNIDPVWSPDGRTAAYITPDRSITLMDMTTGQTLAGISGNWLGKLAMSPDGTLLAARTNLVNPLLMVIWESASGKKIVDLQAGLIGYWILAGDNRTAITLDDSFIRVWDLALRKERYQLKLPRTSNPPNANRYGVTLSANGRELTTAEPDGTLLVWDLSPAFEKSSQATPLNAEQIAGCWTDLANSDPAVAYPAIWKLTDAGEPAVAFLRQQLKPAADADFDKVRKLIKNLDDDSFEIRESASRELEKMGAGIQPAVRQALEGRPTPEVRRRLEALLQTPTAASRSPELLRRLRAISVLERISSKDARQLLTTLSGGVPHAPETQAAKTAQERLALRPGKANQGFSGDSADAKPKQ